MRPRAERLARLARAGPLRAVAAVAALAAGAAVGGGGAFGRPLALAVAALAWCVLERLVEGGSRALVGPLPGALRWAVAGATLAAVAAGSELAGRPLGLGLASGAASSLALALLGRGLDHLIWGAELRRMLDEQSRWNRELHDGRAWLTGQWRSWRRREAELSELTGRILADAVARRSERQRLEHAIGALEAELASDRIPRAENMDYDFTPVHPARPRLGFAPHPGERPPLVSIVTPFFDAGERFAETAASVFGQTLQAWEWIVVNDASRDAASLAALARLRESDPRVRVLDHPVNRGPGAARNTGYAAARADHVLQLDADDLLEPTAAEKWLWYLHTHPEAGFVNGHTVCFGALDGTWDQGFGRGDAFLDRNFVGGRGMVRRRVHAEAGGYDPELALALEDWDFWLRCASAGHWGATLDEVLDWQRRRGSDAEQWPDWDGGERQATARERIRSRHPRLVAEGLPRLARRWQQPYQPAGTGGPGANPLVKQGPRLLLLVDWLEFGGTDRFSLDLLDELGERGWQATVVSTLPSRDLWRWEYLRRTGDVFMLHRFLDLADQPAFLRYLVESRRPDVVLVEHSELGYQLLPALRAWCPEPAYVDFLHILEPDWKSGGYPRMSALHGAHLDLTVTSSEHLRGWLVGQGADPERVAVARTGVAEDRFRPDPVLRRSVRERLRLPESCGVVLFAGRLCAQKRPLLVARVLARLAARGVEFRALVAGDGEDRPALEAAVTALGLGERVHLFGAVGPEGVRELMAASDVLFLPSEREGIALTLFEAMASGLAVVATDVGGQRELVVEGTGILLPAGEDEAAVERFAEAIAGLLGDARRRAEVGRAARARVLDGFTRAEMGARMAELLERSRAQARATPREALSAADAQRTASQAIEFLRLTRVCDWLWTEHLAHQRRDPPAVAPTASQSAPTAASPPPGAPETNGSRPAGARAFAALKRLAEPAYVWGIRNGWRWLVPLKEQVKGRLTRRSAPEAR